MHLEIPRDWVSILELPMKIVNIFGLTNWTFISLVQHVVSCSIRKTTLVMLFIRLLDHVVYPTYLQSVSKLVVPYSFIHSHTGRRCNDEFRVLLAQIVWEKIPGSSNVSTGKATVVNVNAMMTQSEVESNM